jgi:hydrogenase maturation protease
MTALVLGIGHPDRGDDAAGPIVADLLADLPRLVARRVEADPTMMLTDPLWDLADQVVLVDAVRTGATPGSVFEWSGPELCERLPAPTAGGTHDLGLAGALRLAAALGRLPRDLHVIAIEGERFETGAPPSDVVVEVAGQVANWLREWFAPDRGGRRPWTDRVVSATLGTSGER